MKEIRSLSDPNQWRHVPGSMNPADLPSRECGTKQLVESKWWQGPAWLRLPTDQWPLSNDIENEAEINSEMKKSSCRNKKTSPKNSVVIGAHISITQEEREWYMRTQSKYLKIIRAMAWIRRFLNNCRAQQTTRLTEKLATKEFIDAELIILKLTQEELFNEVNESRFSTLNVYRDDNGLLQLSAYCIRSKTSFN